MTAVPRDCALAAARSVYPDGYEGAWFEFDEPKVPNANFLAMLRRGVVNYTRLVNGTVVIWRAKP